MDQQGGKGFNHWQSRKCNFISGIQRYLPLITKPNRTDYWTKQILRRLVAGLNAEVKTEPSPPLLLAILYATPVNMYEAVVKEFVGEERGGFNLNSLRIKKKKKI